MYQAHPNLLIAAVTAVLMAGGPLAAAAQEPDCPEPPNRVEARVEAEVTFDDTTDLFTYRYTVFNEATSLQDIRRFALDFKPPISGIASPAGWKESFFSDRDTLHWYAFENDPLPPGEADTGQILPGKAQIPPGSSLAGFSLQSPNPPGPVTFYVLGFIQVPRASDETEAELLTERCPEFFGTFFDLAVRGTTTGPLDVIVVAIDVKPGSFPNAVNPSTPEVVPVAILTTPQFDATSVDPLSVAFGPGGATEIHRRGHLEDVDGDGDVDLVLHFDIRDSGIRCGDTEVSLTGQTFGGVPILGSDSIKTVGRACR